MAVLQYRGLHQPARPRPAGTRACGWRQRPTPDHSGAEQLLKSDTVDWFPHLSPDGRLASYIRFPSGTQGHPADLPVDVVLVSTDNWAAPLQTWALFGGQGTLNVNSWAPDSTRFAYVAYPLANSNPAKD
jgi:TolB protein